MTYRVHATDPERAREPLFRLWANNLPVSGDLDAKLRWFYHQGPHGCGEAFVLRAHEEPVGCAGLGVRRFAAGDQQFRVALFADFAIERRHRSGLPAIKLVETLKQRAARDFDLGYGFPNAKAVKVYERCGFRLLGHMPRYVRVLRSEPYLRPHVPGWIAPRAGALLDRGLAGIAGLQAWLVDGELELCQPRELGAEFDELWREASRHRHFACARTAELLRWRFLRKPDEVYRVVAMHERHTARLRGYAVLREGTDGLIEIADLFAAGWRGLSALIALLVRAAHELRAPAIAMRFLGDPRVPRLLASHGFSRRAETRAVVIAPGRLPLAGALADPESWYLTDLDEDT